VTDELNSEFWRAIALAVLVNSAPRPLLQVVCDMGTVPADESLRRLRNWNDGCANHLEAQATNELYSRLPWRN
jgi:hypothetical protein